MGKLIYGPWGAELEIDDRTLHHLRVVMFAKLRRGESFTLIWECGRDAGSGQDLSWFSPGVPMQMRFNGNQRISINRHWVDALMLTRTRGWACGTSRSPGSRERARMVRGRPGPVDPHGHHGPTVLLRLRRLDATRRIGRDPMTISSSDIVSVTGATVRGSDGDKIGSVGQVYVDTDGTPVWATVKTGFFGTSESFVPLGDAAFDGSDLQVGYDKDFVKDAPRVDADGELTEEETGSLYDYYGVGGGTRTDTEPQGEYDPYDYDTGSADRAPEAPDDRVEQDATEGRDVSGPTTDTAVTRSEERLRVGTTSAEVGRAVLRKHIVTEQQTVTVPVSHDEVTISREPITAENMGDAMAGGDLTEEEHEVVLMGDRVVTSKETVPKERITLGTEAVTEQREVTEDVRKEQIELDDPTGAARR